MKVILLSWLSGLFVCLFGGKCQHLYLLHELTDSLYHVYFLSCSFIYARSGTPAFALYFEQQQTSVPSVETQHFILMWVLGSSLSNVFFSDDSVLDVE